MEQIVAEAQAAAGDKGFVLFKWTCAGCLERVTFDEPNRVYTKALHSEKRDGSLCGHVTDLDKLTVEADLGYALVMPEVPVAELDERLRSAFGRRDAVRARN